MMRIRALAPRARAISTSCCSGIDSRRTSVSGSMAAPIRSSNCRARARRWSQRIRRQAPPSSSPMAMFSATVKSGNKAGCW